MRETEWGEEVSLGVACKEKLVKALTMLYIIQTLRIGREKRGKAGPMDACETVQIRKTR